jgi:hypothetical protein
MAVELSVNGNDVRGEIALSLPPGTVAAERDRKLDALLVGPLDKIAATLCVVLASPPHRFAKAVPGKDEDGNTRFLVRGRIEGECLSPNHGKRKIAVTAHPERGGTSRLSKNRPRR